MMPNDKRTNTMTQFSSAIRAARANVSPLISQGRNQWIVQTYHANHRGWMSSHSTDYASARKMRAQALADRALVALGATVVDAEWLAHRYYDGGSWIKFVRAMRAKIQTA
jgi:hypothetical protein